MYVEMRYGLAGSCTIVDADVEAVYLVVFEDFLTNDGKDLEEFALFFRSGVEPGSNMPAGYQQGMARRNRVSVPDADYSISPIDDP